MKLMKMLLSALLIFAVCGCTKNDVKDGLEKTVAITLKIEDAMNHKELFTGTVSATGIELTLADVLSANADALQLVSEDTVAVSISRTPPNCRSSAKSASTFFISAEVLSVADARKDASPLYSL